MEKSIFLQFFFKKLKIFAIFLPKNFGFIKVSVSLSMVQKIKLSNKGVNKGFNYNKSYRVLKFFFE